MGDILAEFISSITYFINEYQIGPLLLTTLLVLAIVDYKIGLRSRNAIISFTYQKIKKELDDENESAKEKYKIARNKFYSLQENVLNHEEPEYKDAIKNLKTAFFNYVQVGFKHFRFQEVYAGRIKKRRERVANQNAFPGLRLLDELKKMQQENKGSGGTKFPITLNTTVEIFEELIDYVENYGDNKSREELSNYKCILNQLTQNKK